MSTPTGAPSQLESLVRRLLAYESESARIPGEQNIAVVCRVCEKLSRALGRIMGVVGVRTLLSRALIMAGRRAPSLHRLRVKEDGSLTGFEAQEAKVKSPGGLELEAEVVLLSQLLELLITFIGAELALRLLRDIWPEMKNLDLAEETHHEEK